MVVNLPICLLPAPNSIIWHPILTTSGKQAKNWKYPPNTCKVDAYRHSQHVGKCVSISWSGSLLFPQRLVANAEEVAYNDPPGGATEQLVLNQHLHRLLRYTELSAFQRFLQKASCVSFTGSVGTGYGHNCSWVLARHMFSMSKPLQPTWVRQAMWQIFYKKLKQPTLFSKDVCSACIRMHIVLMDYFLCLYCCANLLVYLPLTGLAAPNFAQILDKAVVPADPVLMHRPCCVSCLFPFLSILVAFCIRFYGESLVLILSDKALLLKPYLWSLYSVAALHMTSYNMGSCTVNVQYLHFHIKDNKSQYNLLPLPGTKWRRLKNRLAASEWNQTSKIATDSKRPGLKTPGTTILSTNRCGIVHFAGLQYVALFG